MNYTIRLPWPPSVNTYWRKAGNVTYLTAKAREFRAAVLHAVGSSETPYVLDGGPLTGRLAVQLELTPPTRRKCDIDNYAKATLDALMHAGVFADDEQVDELRILRLPVESPGACDVTITELLLRRP